MTVSDAVREAITSGAYAHFVTLGKDGSPHVTMAWTGLENDEIVIGTLHDQRKLKDIRRDPRVVVSYEFDRVNAFGLREYLVVYGQGRVTEGGAPELLQDLARVYLGPDVKFPSMPDPPPGFVIRISIDRIAGVGAWSDA